MVIIAVDYGDVRTGIASCDANETLASPVQVILERNSEELAKKIAEIAKKLSAKKIVLGFPKNMDGSEGFRAKATEQLSELLLKESSMPVVLWDERLTTKCATTFLNQRNIRGKKRKEKLDSISATLILQSYIDSLKK